MDPLANLFERYRRHGDLKALGQVFDALAPRLLSVALHVCGNAADAEDVLQQTFLLAMESDVAFDGKRPLEPYFAGVLMNVARNAHRHAARRRAEPLPDLPDGDAGPIAAAERAELLGLLHANVDALPQEQRQVLRLQLQHGLSPAEIAAVLEVPPGTVRMRIHRGIEALRKLLPAGLAIGASAGFAGRGLAAVKQAVLQAGQAKLVAAGVAATSAIGGVLAMKKLAAVVVVMLVVGASWWWWNDLPPFDIPRESSPAPEVVHAVADVPAPPPVAAVQARERVMPTEPSEAGARAPTPTDLWGRVVEVGTDTPIAGAAVELLHCDADEFWNLDLVYGKRIDTIARATSDGDGRFRFQVERARQHRLHVNAAGYAPVTVTDQVGGTDVVITLAHGASMDGVVRCGQELVADVDVRVVVQGKSIELARGRTDGRGVFRFTGLPPAHVYVQVGSDRFEEKWQDLDLVASTHHRVEIELAAGMTLRGRVVDAATGTPVFDAVVSDSWTMKRVVRTDAEGRFALAGLRDEGHVICHVQARGYASARLNVSGKLGEDIELRLVRGGEVAGRVVDGNGAPVAAAYAAVAASFMEARGYQGSSWIPAAVGGDGRFQALGLRPDQHYWLFVRAAGFGTRVYVLARQLGSGERLDVGDVVLQPAGGIEGRVVDDKGAGVAGLEVNVTGTNADSLAWLGTGKAPTHVTQFEGRSVVSDPNGCFRITGLAGGTFEVNAYAPGHRDPVSTKVEVQDGKRVENVELVLPRGSTISGVVEGGGPARAEPLFLEASKDQGNDDYTVMVGADGVFRFDGLPEGSYVLTMRDPPKGWSMAACVGVRAGTTGLKLLLEPAAVITGRVVDEAGKSVEARVWASADGVEAGSTLLPTDAEGRFCLEVHPAFAGKVGAAIAGQWNRRGELQGVVAGQTDIVISLQAPGPSRRR
ncbi:MAG TPA: sigma-70 family RNA polymerase sigma factor [Planctomycetota bacterium]|nr:sigma-70 family RNA polymerase sigma factor [Planctomycetota bacterium]